MVNNKFIKIFSLLFLVVGSIGISNAQSYDLNTFIQLVKKNNKDIKIAKNNIKIASTQSTEASANAYPQLNGELSYRRNLKDNYLYLAMKAPGFPNKLKINRNNEFGGQAVLSQILFNATVFNAIKASKQFENLTDYTYQATLQNVICAAKKAYYQTLLLKNVLQIKKDAEKSAHDNYIKIKNTYDSGLASKLQLMQAEVRWKNSIPESLQAKRNYKLALNTLKNLAGIDENEPFEFAEEFGNIPRRPQLLDLKTALEQRPDYNAMVWERNLRETNISVEKSDFYPSLYASLVYRYSALSDQFKLEDENNYLIAGLTMKIPIFSGFKRTARVERAKIEVEQTNLKIRKFEEKVDNELSNIAVRLDEALQRISAAEATLKTAKQGFVITESSAENGLATQLELKDSRLLFDQAKLNYYAAIYDYLSAYFDWELNMGIIK